MEDLLFRQVFVPRLPEGCVRFVFFIDSQSSRKGIFVHGAERGFGCNSLEFGVRVCGEVGFSGCSESQSMHAHHFKFEMIDEEAELKQVPSKQGDLEAAPPPKNLESFDLELHDVSTKSQLSLIPDEFLNFGSEKKPLKFGPHTFALRPLSFCVILILLMEGLERLSFYGINYTLTSFLTGAYGPWSPNLSSATAASWVQISTAIAYSVPFLGAIISDGLLGNYATILVFTICTYIPGLALIALSAASTLWSDFPTTMLGVGVLGLYPVGAGGIKACVNVMGAQQYHPVLQKGQISRYFVQFYMWINIGALIGGIVVPILCQIDVFAAYLVPVVFLSIGTSIFILGTPRYVKFPPKGSSITKGFQVLGSSLTFCPPSMDKVKQTRGGPHNDVFVEKVKTVGRLLVIMLYTLPFNMCYSQMSSVWIIQGQAMKSVGFVDAAMMQNADAISVLIFAWLFSTFIMPFLSKRGLELHPVTKFGIGSAFGSLALLCSIAVDLEIHQAWNSSQQELNIFWQTPQFMLIGAGEIFTIASAYDVAFKISPVGLKSFGSALNLFVIGALPSFISSGILNACNAWFLDASGSGDLNDTASYAQAHVYKYLAILFGISLVGIIISFLPSATSFYENTLQRSEALCKEK